jgi:hypothetical protein
MKFIRRIQIAIPEDKYRKAKSALAERGLTWQKWGEGQIDGIFTESIDRFGIPIMEMAVNKDQFMTKIQEKFVGALREYAFVIIAKRNNHTKWVKHKETEIERLGLELMDVFDLDSKGKWNKIKAATQAIEYYRPILKTFITKAQNQYVRYYLESPKHSITEADLLPFLENILTAILSA